MNELAISIVVNVALGLLLLALLCWKRSPDTARLAGPVEAVDIFLRQIAAAAGDVTVAADGRAALIDLNGDGRVGLLQRHGRRWNARALAAGEVRSAQFGDEDERADTIELRLADFGWPRAQIRIEDFAERTRWLRRLQALGGTHA
jgi:hypothetical protein